jgi:hypothetical protein
MQKKLLWGTVVVPLGLILALSSLAWPGSGSVPALTAGIPYNTSAVANTIVQRDASAGVTNGPESITQLTCSGSVSVKWNAQTTSYAIQWGASGDHVIFANTAGGSITLTLPSPATVGAGGMLRVIRPSASNTLTLALNAAEKINGTSANKNVTATANLMVLIFTDGTDWYVNTYNVI